MLTDAHKRFNRECFSPEKYRRLLAAIHAEAGETCVRMSETPVFLSRDCADTLVRGATEIIGQSLSPALRPLLDRAVPSEFNLPSAPPAPAFFIVDFALTDGLPQLIEMQGFAANLFFIPAAAKIYKDVYGLGDGCSYLLSDISAVPETILGGHAPENVILMEIDPWRQPSRRDFVVTQKRLGIPVVDATEVLKEGEHLFYRNAQGSKTAIHRIYSRVIPTEFERLGLSEKTSFRFNEKLSVEWIGDPSWFLRISKHTMPYLSHPMVPETYFINQIKTIPDHLENYVLKPTNINAGTGVNLNPAREDIESIPPGERSLHILMKKIRYLPFIPDLNGNLLNAEIRVMFVNPGRLCPVAFSARIMRGSDTNAGIYGNDDWCGMTPVFVVDDFQAFSHTV